MQTWKKLSALVAAGALVFALGGIASAASVTPTFTEGNITVEGGGNNDAAACDPDDALFFDSGEDGAKTTANGVEVTITYNVPDDGGFDFVASGGLVTIVYVKGSNGYYTYDYGAGVASDDDLYAPDAGGSGSAAAVSHLVICTTPAEESEETETEEPSEEPSFEQSEGAETDVPTEPPTSTIGGGTSGPADGAWLLVVALGVFLASVVVLTPARAKNR